METTSTYDRSKSKEEGRQRTVAILDRLQYGLCSKQELLDIVPNRKSLDRIMMKLVRRKQVNMYYLPTTDANGLGQRFLYSCSKHSNLAHNHAVMVFLKAIGWPDCDLRPAAINGCFPDAIVCEPKERILEIDMATESEGPIREKAKAYKECGLTIAWVCPNETRKRKLIEWTTDVHGQSVYGIFKTVTAMPHDRVWFRDDGSTVALRWCVEAGAEGGAACVR